MSRRREVRGRQRAIDEIAVARTRVLVEAERDLELAAADARDGEVLELRPEVAPPFGFRREVPLDLERHGVGDFSLDAEGPLAQVDRLEFTGVGGLRVRPRDVLLDPRLEVDVGPLRDVQRWVVLETELRLLLFRRLGVLALVLLLLLLRLVGGFSLGGSLLRRTRGPRARQNDQERRGRKDHRQAPESESRNEEFVTKFHW